MLSSPCRGMACRSICSRAIKASATRPTVRIPGPSTICSPQSRIARSFTDRGCASLSLPPGDRGRATSRLGKAMHGEARGRESHMERMVRVYDSALVRHRRGYYDNSGFFNFGYWDSGARTQPEASAALVDELVGRIAVKGGRILDVACGV